MAGKHPRRCHELVPWRAREMPIEGHAGVSEHFVRFLGRTHDGEHAGTAETGRSAFRRNLAAEQDLCLGRRRAAEITRAFRPVRACGVARNLQPMSGGGDTLPRGLKQRVGHGRRIGAAGSFALRIDQRGEGDCIPFRYAEHRPQHLCYELHGRLIVIMENEPDRLGVGENVVHERPLNAASLKEQKKNITKGDVRQAGGIRLRKEFYRRRRKVITL